MEQAEPVQIVQGAHGIGLAVHDLGGEGPPLLLCHATGFCGLVWRPLAQHLAGYHALAIDFRGHGDSPAPDDHLFDWNGFAEDVLAVVDALDLHGCVAVGHSKGGAALLLAEEQRPGTFAALWLFEPVVFHGIAPTGRDNPMAAGARRRRPSFPSREAAIENFRSKPPLNVLAPEALEAYVDGGFSTAADGSVHLKCLPESEARVFEMGGQHDAYDNLDRVRIPVTVARGRIEPGPSMFAEGVVDRLPHGRLEVYEHLGHFGPLEAPAEMAAAVQTAFTFG